jgi:spore coat protein U-like protein
MGFFVSWLQLSNYPVRVFAKTLQLCLICGLLFIFQPNSAQASCEIMFSDVHYLNWEGDGKNLGYNVFSQQTITQAIKFEIIRTDYTDDSTACQVAIGIENTTAASETNRYLFNAADATAKLNYQLFLDNAATVPWRGYEQNNTSLQNMKLVSFGPVVTITDYEDDTTSNTATQVNAANTAAELITPMRNLVTARANEDAIDKQEFVIYWQIPALQMVTPGTYQANLILTAYEVEQSGFVPQDQQALTLTAKVKETINCSLSKAPIYLPGSPNKYKINFGLLDFGKAVADDFFLVVRANTGFNYQLRSDNNGELALEEKFNNGKKTKLPYQLLIDNNLYNFQAKAIQTKTTKMTPLDGLAIPIKVMISGDLNLADYAAGTYHDSVYLTVSTE